MQEKREIYFEYIYRNEVLMEKVELKEKGTSIT